ncbi:MAG: hypothetical protein WBJ81_01505, partial [Rickettsiales bacterium]
MSLFCELNAKDCAKKIAQITNPVERVEAFEISPDAPLASLRQGAMALGLFSDAELYGAESYLASLGAPSESTTDASTVPSPCEVSSPCMDSCPSSSPCSDSAGAPRKKSALEDGVHGEDATM